MFGKPSNKIKKTVSGTIFDVFNVIFMVLLCFTTLYPFMYLLSMSLSSANISLTKIYFIPPEISLVNFKTILGYEYITTGALNSVVRVLLGTSIELVMSLLFAYPLSKKYLPHRNIFTGFVVFTMFFSGGLIPSYILINDLNLMGSMWSLILPTMIPTFSMLIIRNNLMQLPESIEESAKLDGAGELTILFKILIHMIKPILATVALWSIVGHWNSWFDSVLYISDPKKQVLQAVIRNILNSGDVQSQLGGSVGGVFGAAVTPEKLKAAAIMITTIPIIAVYPFLQKYFVKGIMIGSLKG